MCDPDATTSTQSLAQRPKQTLTYKIALVLSLSCAGASVDDMTCDLLPLCRPGSAGFRSHVATPDMHPWANPLSKLFPHSIAIMSHGTSVLSFKKKKKNWQGLSTPTACCTTSSLLSHNLPLFLREKKTKHVTLLAPSCLLIALPVRDLFFWKKRKQSKIPTTRRFRSSPVSEKALRLVGRLVGCFCCTRIFTYWNEKKYQLYNLVQNSCHN